MAGSEEAFAHSKCVSSRIILRGSLGYILRGRAITSWASAFEQTNKSMGKLKLPCWLNPSIPRVA
jgi:hypothetical protein